MSDGPVRIQRQRTKGWRLPENTVCVDRSTKWGNPYAVGGKMDVGEHGKGGIVPSAELAVILFRGNYGVLRENANRQLRGKNLACFCPLDQPCHADVLLEWANA